jgi:hypothetical protein
MHGVEEREGRDGVNGSALGFNYVHHDRIDAKSASVILIFMLQENLDLQYISAII